MSNTTIDQVDAPTEREKKIRKLAKQLRDAYIAYGEAMRRGDMVFPPLEEDFYNAIQKILIEEL